MSKKRALQIRRRCIFKTVLARLFDSHALDAGVGKTGEALKNHTADILRGRHAFAKFRNLLVHVRVVERIENLLSHETIEIREIRNHARCRINRAGNTYF